MEFLLNSLKLCVSKKITRIIIDERSQDGNGSDAECVQGSDCGDNI